jgi:hypothetical protein
LKRDVGNGAQDRGERDDDRERLVLAVTRGHEVRDRGDVLRLSQPRDLYEQRTRNRESENGAEIDRKEIEACGRSEAHRPEKGPRGAVHRDRERIDVGTAPTVHPGRPHAIAICREREKQSEIDQRHRDHGPAVLHPSILNTALQNQYQPGARLTRGARL